MNPLTGTLALVRINLRLDRVRLAVWTLAIGLGVWASVVALEAAYPTPESLQSRAILLENPATIMMTGPAFALDDYTLGAAVANELSLYVFLSAAIMSILLMVRHTRGEEESGRLELVRSLPVGRYAPATAALATVAVANLAVGAATAAGLVAGGMPWVDSLAFGLATGLTGLVFAAIAAVAAQLTEHARSATGLATMALAAAFLVRGVGDVIDHQGSWLSWFSPFAWAQQTRLLVDLRWWPLAVSAVVALALFAVAVAFARSRDLGAGLVPTRPGPPGASRALLSPAGLAQRLLRGSVIAWTIGAFLLGMAMGALANEIQEMLDENPAIAEWVALTGSDPTAEFAGIIMAYTMIAPLVLAVSGVLRLRPEEDAGRLEQLVASGRSRIAVVTGWLATVVSQTVVSTVICGVGVGIGVALGTGDASWVGEMLVAALAFLPAVLLTAALACALFGLLPQATGVAWLVVVWITLVLFLGELLNLPGWLRGVSPFHHTPVLPAQEFEALPLLAMGGLAVGLAAAGAAGFCRRDLAAK